MSYLGRKGSPAPLVSSDIPDNSITGAKIVTDTIAAGDIGTDAVGADELANNAVDTNAIADDAITGGKLANDIAISTTGAIATTGDLTVDTNTLKVDSSNNRVGIGTTSPDSQLEILSGADNTTPLTVRDVSDGFNIFRVTAETGGHGTLGMKSGGNSETIFLKTSGDSEIKGGGLEVLGLVARDTHPSNDQAYDLGHSGGRWRDAYIRDGVTTGSDRNLKRDIETSALGIDFINKLKPVSYKWKDIPAILYGEDDLEGGSKQGDIKVQEQIHKRTHYGLIAQDVKTTLDELGIDTVDFAGYGDGKAKLDADGNKIGEDGDCALRYTEFISPLIKAIQELSAKVTALENA